MGMPLRGYRCTLYVTVEPCIMCSGALSLLGFRQVRPGLDCAGTS